MDLIIRKTVNLNTAKKLKKIQFFCVFLMIIVLLLCSAVAESEENTAAEFGREALAATGHAQFLQFPEEEDYLPETKTLYARKAFHAPCLEVKAVPDQMVMGRNMPYLYEGTAVTVVAEQGEMACIIYPSSNNKTYCGWIRSIRLLEEFPGETYTCGTEPTAAERAVKDGITCSWGEPGYAKYWHPYTKLSDEVQNCIGFTLEYQMIAENTEKWGNIFGDRLIMICNGQEWIEVGQFPYPEQGAVKVQVWLDKPITVTAVSTRAQCLEPDTPDTRQLAYDFITAG